MLFPVMPMSQTKSFVIPAIILVLLSACGDAAKSPAGTPTKSEPVSHESELLRITLKADAVKRLGIATVKAGKDTAIALRETSGEIVVPNGPGGVPTGALSNLAQIGVSQAAADGEVDRSRAQVRLARIALARADRLVADEAGSVRARDEAATALATAEAQANAALAQRRLLGPAVAALGQQPIVWVRVSVSGTDIANVDRTGRAQVTSLGAGGGFIRTAAPVSAPPSANAAAGTVDLYYMLDNRDRTWRIGQRVSVRLPLGQITEGFAIPASALVRDIYGGEWVYVQTVPNSYVRQRVEALSSDQHGTILARGVKSGAAIVATGAMELFGTEFGVAH